MPVNLKMRKDQSHDWLNQRAPFDHPKKNSIRSSIRPPPFPFTYVSLSNVTHMFLFIPHSIIVYIKICIIMCIMMCIIIKTMHNNGRNNMSHNLYLTKHNHNNNGHTNMLN